MNHRITHLIDQLPHQPVPLSSISVDEAIDPIARELDLVFESRHGRHVGDEVDAEPFVPVVPCEVPGVVPRFFEHDEGGFLPREKARIPAGRERERETSKASSNFIITNFSSIY